MSDQPDPSLPPSPTTMEEMRDYLHRQHGVTVGRDDPVLMLHSMHLVFLQCQEQLLERHNQALTQVIGEAVRGLTAEALANHLQDQVRLADRTIREFQAQYKRARLLTMASLGSALVCLPVLIVLLFK